MPTEPYHRIRQRFVAVVISVLLILGGLFVWQSARERKLVVASAETSSASYAAALTEHAGLVFGEVDSLLNELASNIEERGGSTYAGSAPFHRSLNNRVKNELQFNSISVLDKDGNLVAHSREYPVTSRNLADLTSFKHHRDTPDSSLFISPLHTSPVDNYPHFSVSRALRGANGEFAGLVSLAV